MLRDVGTLHETYIVFSSDNGYHLGQHRLPAGKQTPYDSDTHVPFVVRGPGIAHGATVTALSSTVDVMPTFLAMAGVDVPLHVDGRSLLDAARAPTVGPGIPTSRRAARALERSAAGRACGPPGPGVAVLDRAGRPGRAARS